LNEGLQSIHGGGGSISRVGSSANVDKNKGIIEIDWDE
jgi:hypothetical protein